MLADVIIHCQDVFVPLRIDRHAGAAAVLAERCQAGAPRSGADPGAAVLALCVTDDDAVREITTTADDIMAFHPGPIAVSHGTGNPQPDERGRHAAGRLAGTAHLLARPAGARS